MGTREGAECTHGGKTRLGQGRDKVRCTTPSQRNHSTPAARSAHNSQLLLGRDCNGPYEQMLLGSSLTLAGFTILMSRSVPAQTTYTYYMTTLTTTRLTTCSPYYMRTLTTARLTACRHNSHRRVMFRLPPVRAHVSEHRVSLALHAVAVSKCIHVLVQASLHSTCMSQYKPHYIVHVIELCLPGMPSLIAICFSSNYKHLSWYKLSLLLGLSHQ